jgi:hypothetical protein
MNGTKAHLRPIVSIRLKIKNSHYFDKYHRPAARLVIAQTRSFLCAHWGDSEMYKYALGVALACFMAAPVLAADAGSTWADIGKDIKDLKADFKDLKADYKDLKTDKADAIKATEAGKLNEAQKYINDAIADRKDIWADKRDIHADIKDLKQDIGSLTKGKH